MNPPFFAHSSFILADRPHGRAKMAAARASPRFSGVAEQSVGWVRFGSSQLKGARMSNRLILGLLAAGIALSFSEACQHSGGNTTGTAGSGSQGTAGTGSTGTAGTTGGGNTTGSAGTTGTAGSSTTGTAGNDPAG